MKKIKILLSVALFTATVFSLTSCGGPYSDIDFDKYISISDYKSVTVEPIDIKVTDEDVEAEIQQRLEDKKTTKDVKSGVVKDGDVINIDYVGSIDGVKFEGGEESNRDLTIGSNTFIDGFESGLIGAEVGKTTSIKVKFPANYSKEDLAGKNAIFSIKVNSREEEVIPALDKKFVKANSDFDNVEDYRASVRKEITEKKQLEAEEAQRTKVWSDIVMSSNMKKDDKGEEKYPKEELERVIKETTEMYEDIAKKNNVTLEEFVSQSFGMDIDTFNVQIEELSKIMVKEDLIIYYIADKEGIEVSRTDYKKFMQRTLEKYGYTEESFKEANNGKAFEEIQGKDKIKADTLKEKVQKFIVKNAK